MTSEILISIISVGSSLITGALTLLGVIITNNSKQKIVDLKQEQALNTLEQSVNGKLEVFGVNVNSQISQIHSAIEELDRKQEKHNNVIERTYVLEKDVSVLKTEYHSMKEALQKNSSI